MYHVKFDFCNNWTDGTKPSLVKTQNQCYLIVCYLKNINFIFATVFKLTQSFLLKNDKSLQNNLSVLLKSCNWNEPVLCSDICLFIISNANNIFLFIHLTLLF